ncbi:MAG TPA: RNase adapter RapZ [Methylomusa anaerophila]|uniref:GlmZ(SRNA)-inactivating NTPase n=1 Tax=Methylomusa anaerophila TaxID=1930071 RepID=A0A348AL08_9FIRM|nr:RNase adapter RapZ [Methylomusa anaerophila]BBB91756.1 glmZ(sRNA)-inactivating NTPase [Methylomusa anaerophila]HML88507.1 RNase adapter RapZ [Methylomusa anaerophila]
MDNFRLVIVTGMSGAGKSQVVRAMEDLGYFCVDNLPPMLIPKFAELCAQSGGKVSKIALVVDIRGGEFFDTLIQVLEDMEKQGYLYEILFLEAADATLIRRYKETRRRHPMAPHGRISEGIMRERDRLEHIRGRATHIIDTSGLSTTELKGKIIALFAEDREHERMTITVVSFGFKYGIPLDADMVLDVRFLPNPFYVESLRRHSGKEPQVGDYIWKWPVTQQFMEKLSGLVDFLVPHYVKEGKSQLIIAIGCTGGLHRSVFVAEKIHESLKGKGYKTNVEHRDIKHNITEV